MSSSFVSASPLSKAYTWSAKLRMKEEKTFNTHMNCAHGPIDEHWTVGVGAKGSINVCVSIENSIKICMWVFFVHLL